MKKEKQIIYNLVLFDKLYIYKGLINNLENFFIKFTAYIDEDKIPLYTYLKEKQLYVVNIGYKDIINDFLTKPYIIADLRVTQPLQYPVTWKGNLRPGQLRLLDKWETDKEMGTIVAKPGFGKTVLGTKLIEKFNQETIVLVPTLTIQKQWIKSCEKFLGINPGSIGDAIWDIQPITIACYQSLIHNKRFDEEVRKRFGFLIVDEAHKAPAAAQLKLISSFCAKYKVAFTATPYRKDRLHLHLPGLFSSYTVVSTEEVKKAKVNVICTDFIFKFSPYTNYPRALTLLAKDKKFNSFVALKIKKDFINKRNILVMSPRIEQLENIAKILLALDIPNGRLRKIDSNKDRQHNLEVLELARSKSFVLLATDKLVGLGFDEDYLDCLHMPYSYNNKQLFEQFVGRIEREDPTNKNKQPILIDYHFVPESFTKFQQEQRLLHYKELGYKYEIETV